jgi:hypothetical protein
VVEELGGDKTKVKFTEAIRPRKGDAEVPVCEKCEENYGRESFPPNTIFKNDELPKN